jgi:hypothetical protein
MSRSAVSLVWAGDLAGGGAGAPADGVHLGGEITGGSKIGAQVQNGHGLHPRDRREKGAAAMCSRPSCHVARRKNKHSR